MGRDNRGEGEPAGVDEVVSSWRETKQQVASALSAKLGPTAGKSPEKSSRTGATTAITDNHICLLVFYISDEVKSLIAVIMLRSTYAPPPPLPPGWTEHKAPSGKLRLTLQDFPSLTGSQAICTTLIYNQSNQLIHDRSLLPLSRNRQDQLVPVHRSSHRIRYPHSLLRRTHPRDLDLALDSPGPIISKVQLEEDFVVEKRTKIANHGRQRTGQNPSMRYLDANRGCL